MKFGKIVLTAATFFVVYRVLENVANAAAEAEPSGDMIPEYGFPDRYQYRRYMDWTARDIVDRNLF